MQFNRKLCEWRSVPLQDFLSAVFTFEDSRYQCSVTCQNIQHVLSVISASRGRSHSV